MSKLTIGIDCGLDGGIVTLDIVGNILDQRVMPVVKVGKGRKIDLHELSDFLQMRLVKAPTMVIEDPGGHAQSAAGLRSMTYSFAVCEALCVAHGLRYHLVRAQAWQKEFWTKPSMAKGQKFDTKAAALAEAKKLWPGNDWTATERSVKPHSGLVDAALIGEYARRKGI